LNFTVPVLLQITDVLGVQIFRNEQVSESNKINITNYPSGIYLIRVTNGTQLKL